MRSWGSLLVGAIGLAVLDGVVSRSGATGRVGSWLSGAGSIVRRFLDPTIPFFSTPASSSSTTSAQQGGTPTYSTVAAPSAPVFTTPPLAGTPAPTLV